MRDSQRLLRTIRCKRRRGVGTGLAPVRKKSHKKSNTARVVPTVANVFKFDETQAPSDEGAVERSETEGEKAINIKLSLSLPQSFFCEKRQLPRQREP